MKVNAVEFEGCYSLELIAETIEDAAFLVRMGMDSTRELRSVGTNVYKDNTVRGHVVVGKRKQFDSVVPKRKDRK